MLLWQQYLWISCKRVLQPSACSSRLQRSKAHQRLHKARPSRLPRRQCAGRQRAGPQAVRKVLHMEQRGWQSPQMSAPRQRSLALAYGMSLLHHHPQPWSRQLRCQL